MFDSPPISQLSLLRLNTQKTLAAPKCTVFYLHNQALNKITISVEDGTTVRNIISQAIDLFKETNTPIKAGRQDKLSLYACRKNGRKCSDLPSFDENTKVGMTGIKNFLLTESHSDAGQPKKKSDIRTATTRSIQSSMMAEPKKKKEVKPTNAGGCFCFS